MSRRIRSRGPILQVMEPLDGGVARYVLWLSRGLHERGWQVEVVTGAGSMVLAELQEAGVPVHELPLRKSALAGAVAARDLRRLDRDRRYRLVHAHSSWAGFLGRAALRGRQRIVYSPHCFSFLGKLPLPTRALGWAAEQALVPRTARIVGAGPWEIRAGAARLVGGRRRARVVPTGVPEPPETEADQRMLSFAAGAPLVGMVAALRAQKAPLSLVLAAGVLARQGRLRARVAIVGDGPLAETVESEILRLGLEGRVRRFSFLGTSEPHMRALDLLVLPSEWEAYSIAVLEAFACGVPVLATDVGGTAELLGHGSAGGLVRPGDPEALADALAGALAEPSLLATWASAGRERHQREHRLGCMIDATERVYREVLDGDAGVALEEKEEIPDAQ